MGKSKPDESTRIRASHRLKKDDKYTNSGGLGLTLSLYIHINIKRQARADNLVGSRGGLGEENKKVRQSGIRVCVRMC